MAVVLAQPKAQAQHPPLSRPDHEGSYLLAGAFVVAAAGGGAYLLLRPKASSPSSTPTSTGTGSTGTGTGTGSTGTGTGTGSTGTGTGSSGSTPTGNLSPSAVDSILLAFFTANPSVGAGSAAQALALLNNRPVIPAGSIVYGLFKCTTFIKGSPGTTVSAYEVVGVKIPKSGGGYTYFSEMFPLDLTLPNAFAVQGAGPVFTIPSGGELSINPGDVYPNGNNTSGILVVASTPVGLSQGNVLNVPCTPVVVQLYGGAGGGPGGGPGGYHGY